MNSRLAELTRRKEYLTARCAREREELARCCERFHTLFKISNAVAGAGRLLKEHPEIVLALSGFFARGRAARMGRAGRAARRVLIFWPILRSLGSWWSGRRTRR